MVASWGNRQPIVRSVQRGTISTAGTSNTATITAVDTAHAELVWLGLTQTANNANYSVMAGRIALTNTTTVTATLANANGTTIFSYEVMEYFPGFFRSVQRGTVAVGTGASATATVTSVNMLKARLTGLGYVISTGAAPTNDTYLLKSVFTNATTITFDRATADANNSPTAGYQLLEHYL